MHKSSTTWYTGMHERSYRWNVHIKSQSLCQYANGHRSSPQENRAGVSIADSTPNTYAARCKSLSRIAEEAISTDSTLVLPAAQQCKHAHSLARL